MPPFKKLKKESNAEKEERERRQIYAFNKFACEIKDMNGEPFYYLDGTQITQNFRCTLDVKYVLDKFREQNK